MRAKIAARALGALAVAIALGMSAVTAQATPDVSDIEQSKRAQRQTSESIAGLEQELVANSLAVRESDERAMMLEEDAMRMQEQLQAATVKAEQAAETAREAEKQVALSRRALTEMGLAQYRNGSNPLSAVEPYLGQQDFAQSVHSGAVLAQVAGRAEVTLQKVRALEQVSQLMREQAKESEAEKARAADSAEAVAREARDAYRVAETKNARMEARKTELIEKLAQQRNTTIELEKERQENLEARRRAREEQQALQRALEAQRRAAARDAAAAAAKAAPAPVAVRQSPAQAPASRPLPPRRVVPQRPAPVVAAPAPAARPTPVRPATPSPAAPVAKPAPAPPSPVPVKAVSPYAAKAIEYGRKQMGKPYVYGTVGPSTYDCSGLTLMAFQAAGKSLPRSSRSQYNATARVPLSQLKPGDLVFWSRNGKPSGVYHVAIYMGGGTIMHASNPRTGLVIAKMYHRNIMPYGGRVL